MAATATPTEEQVPLRILVDGEKNCVLFAEAGKDFVDVLLSFLTLPLGTIARLVGKESNMQPVRVGSLSSLYESVANLDEECLWTETCKEMLLKPRNSMEAYCRMLKLNIDDTEPLKYFICEDWRCSQKGYCLLSTFRNLRCRCGKLLNREISTASSNLHNGFVQETATFIICDDLKVIPNVLGTSVALLRNLGIEDINAVKERTVNITKKEALDLLKCSLLSKTPLTDFFLKKKQFLDNFNPTNLSQLAIGQLPTNQDRQMDVKVLVRKSDSKILFAEAEEDFADFLFSFLTIPLGGVLHLLQGCSSLSCMDNLYKSIAELSSDRYLISKGLKDNLANPHCGPQFKLHHQILPIVEADFPVYYCISSKSQGTSGGYLNTEPCRRYPHTSTSLSFVDPMSSTGEKSNCRGFAKGPLMFMVTDELVVTPMSSISGIAYLNRLNVPICDLEERVISIGLKEGLSILKASLWSTTALTNGLNQALKRRIDQIFLSCLGLK